MDANRVLLEKVERGEIRVNPDTLRELYDYEASCKREAEALQRGWEPWNPNEELFYGLVEKPKGELRTELVVTSAVSAATLMGAIGLGVLVSPESGWFALPVTLVVICFITAAFTLSLLMDWRGFRWPVRERYQLYTGPMPMDAWRKYKRDKHLFDDVVVVSHTRAHFRAYRAPRAQEQLADPWLVGRIGAKWFMGAQWDVADELSVSPEDRAQEPARVRETHEQRVRRLHREATENAMVRRLGSTKPWTGGRGGSVL